VRGWLSLALQAVDAEISGQLVGDEGFVTGADGGEVFTVESDVLDIPKERDARSGFLGSRERWMVSDLVSGPW
jgi:hypothetical protein